MKKRKRKIIKDPKARGEWVESVFLARAGELGIAVSRPWGDSRSYDFVVGRPGHFGAVQVKSTTIESGGGYACVIRQQGKAYPRGSFDFVAAYVVPQDVWYIIPASKVWDKECVTLCSESPQAQYEEYREAWHLLREAGRSKDEGGGCGSGGDCGGACCGRGSGLAIFSVECVWADGEGDETSQAAAGGQRVASIEAEG